MKNSLLLTFCVIAICQTAFSQTYHDSVTIEFRQSKIKLDPEYKENGAKLDSFMKRFTPVADNGARYALKSVNIYGAASPEGSVEFNKYLSEERAKAIYSKVQSYLPDSLVDFSFLGQDWNGLRLVVERDMSVPYKTEVLRLLDEMDGSVSGSYTLKELKSLRKGIPYGYMYHNLFPDLRMSKVVVGYERLLLVADSMPHLEFLPMPGPLKCPDLTFEFQTGSVMECKPFYLGLKTNLLSDILLIPHIGADLYVGRGWSLTADWMYGWWDKDRTHHYWRAYGGTLGVRKWLGKKAAEKPLTGHHIGVYAGAVTYDFEFGGRGYMGGKPHGTLWERCNFTGGVEYGYSMPVARRLNIDFTIGIGYLGGRYLEYVPKDGFYMWESTHNLNWFGPTKAEVSLVWLIGCDNFNRKKGGRL